MLRLLLLLLLSATASAATSITFTRAEIDEMARLWETDSVAISDLANAQYPQFSGDWQFVFPHTNISGDGDIHIDLALDAAGTGRTGNNTGASPIVAEVTNASSAQLSHLVSLTGAQAIPRGIFRFYTEHASERHFELHPAVQLQRWNGTEFFADSDYHQNIAAVPDGTTHASSTLVNLLNGSQTVTATNASDNIHVDFIFPSPTASPSPSPSLLNISTRLRVGTGDNVLIGGFIVQGNAAKKVILRAIGPSLAAAGVEGVLTDPMLELHDADGTLIGRNDNWRTTQPGGVISGDQAAAIEASTLAPANDAEAAILATLAPRSYTAIVRGAQNQTGIGLAEVYDLDQGTPTRLANISTRGFVETGDNVMIAGFIIGNQPTRIIVRGIGPALTRAGIVSPLSDPMLELRDGNGALIAANDNWRSDDETKIIATTLAPSEDLEAALVRKLAPANYTAIA